MTTKHEQELKPCPFCGNPTPTALGGGMSQDPPSVVCMKCFSEAPARIWNTRA